MAMDWSVALKGFGGYLSGKNMAGDRRRVQQREDEEFAYMKDQRLKQAQRDAMQLQIAQYELADIEAVRKLYADLAQMIAAPTPTMQAQSLAGSGMSPGLPASTPMNAQIAMGAGVGGGSGGRITPDMPTPEAIAGGGMVKESPKRLNTDTARRDRLIAELPGARGDRRTQIESVLRSEYGGVGLPPLPSPQAIAGAQVGQGAPQAGQASPGGDHVAQAIAVPQGPPIEMVAAIMDDQKNITRKGVMRQLREKYPPHVIANAKIPWAEMGIEDDTMPPMSMGALLARGGGTVADLPEGMRSLWPLISRMDPENSAKFISAAVKMDDGELIPVPQFDAQGRVTGTIMVPKAIAKQIVAGQAQITDTNIRTDGGNKPKAETANINARTGLTKAQTVQTNEETKYILRGIQVDEALAQASIARANRAITASGRVGGNTGAEYQRALSAAKSALVSLNQEEQAIIRRTPKDVMGNHQFAQADAARMKTIAEKRKEYIGRIDSISNALASAVGMYDAPASNSRGAVNPKAISAHDKARAQKASGASVFDAADSIARTGKTSGEISKALQEIYGMDRKKADYLGVVAFKIKKYGQYTANGKSYTSTLAVIQGK